MMIKRICGHSSPYTFKKNERFAKQRLDSFLSKKCPACTKAAIAELEAKQKADGLAQRTARKKKPAT
ncbi:MAG: hypothetical protein AB7O62_14420 [Pirellulales bacterium]